MADDKNLIASSEFDNSAFIKGFQQMTATVDSFIKKEQELTGVLERQEKELTENQKAIAATKAQIDALDKSSNTFKNDLAALNKQQADQLARQRDQKTAIQATRQELEGTGKTIREYDRAFKNLGITIKQVSDQTRGKNIFDVRSLALQVANIQQAGGKLREIFANGIDDEALVELEQRLASTNDEFKQLAEIIGFVKQKMDTLDPNSEDFKVLADIVKTGEQVLEDFGKTTEETGKKSVSLRARLRELREELSRMEDAGEENTERFQAMQIEAGRLADTISDTQDRIRVLASDTKALDFGLAAIRGFAAGATLAAGATELFGLRNEDVLETIARLNALMAVLNGLQELHNILKKQSVVLIVGQEIANKALIASQRVLAAAFGQTAAASRGLQLALLSSGIGALVVLIGALVVAFKNWDSVTEDMVEEQNRLNESTERAIKLNERLIQAIATGNDTRIAAIEALQEQNKNLTASERQQLEERIRNAQQLRDAEIESTKQQVIAGESLEREQEKNFERAKARLAQIREIERATGGVADEGVLKELQRTIDNFTALQQTNFDLRNRLNLQEIQNLRDQARERNELRLLEIRQTEDFEKRLRELQQRLQDARNNQRPQNEEQLRRQAQIRLERELADIDRQVKKGDLTSARGEILKSLLRQISSVETEAEIKEFRKKVVEAARALDEELTNLRLQAATQRAELIRDELTREAATIEASAKEERTQLLQERDALLREIRENPLGLDEKTVKSNADRILEIYNTLLLQLSTRTRRAQEELQARAFEIAQEQARRAFADIGLKLTQATTAEIINLTQRFQAGKIGYEEYQKELTKIAQAETQKRIGTQITEINALLFNARRRLPNEADPQRKQQLEDQIRDLETQLSELQRRLAEGQAEGIETGRQALAERVAIVAQYAQAVGGIVQSVVGFWQAANDAERASLEKSISLQERRVEAATRIAERGNAEYLRLEEDRLRELEIKQENAARRQIAINAVLQTSQALTAFVGALSQGIATGGPLGGIAIAGAVLGLLASGYAIIQNLQKQNVQRLYKGTKRVTRNGEPSGVDTVPAMLTEGEGVVPADKNQAYADTMDAVHDGSVPPEVLNNFVRHYHNNMDMPVLDYARMQVALQHSDKGLMRSMLEQNSLLRQQNEQLENVTTTLKGMGVNFNLDRNGFAASVGLAMAHQQLLKKA